MKQIILILCCLLLVSPVFAQTISYTATADEAVWAVNINSPVSTHGTIQLYQANGDTVSGTWSYVFGLPTSTFTAEIGDSGSEPFSYLIPAPVGMSIWNGDNTSKAREIKLGYGQLASTGLQQGWNNVLVTEIDRAVITGYTVSADNDISVSHELVSRRSAAADLNADVQEPGLVDLLKAYAPLAASVFLGLIYWLKFIFVDHLIITFALYFTGSMAYAIWTSKDIFTFYKKWFDQQKKFFEFMANAFSTTFQIITQVAVVVGNAVGSLINVALIAAKILLRI